MQSLKSASNSVNIWNFSTWINASIISEVLDRHITDHDSPQENARCNKWGPDSWHGKVICNWTSTAQPKVSCWISSVQLILVPVTPPWIKQTRNLSRVSGHH